jgi:polysaccharide chain length determinant protein (PEP-CTERM system associated)
MVPGKTYKMSDYLAIARRRLPLLILPPLVALFFSLIYSATLPDVYEPDALMAIVPQRVPDNFVQSTVTLKTEDRLEALTTQVTSRTVLEQLILEFDLYPEERSRLPMEDVVRIMRSSVTVALEAQRRGPRGLEPPHAFHVRFKYANPVVATRVTERFGSMFIDQNTRDRGALAEATDQFLQGELAEARGRLESVEKRLEAFRERHGNELPTQVQANMQVIQSTQLQIQSLVEGIARDRDRKLMLERLHSEAQREPVMPTPPSSQGTSQQPVDGMSQSGTAEQQLAAARQALGRLQTRLTPEHPDVIRTRRLISDLEPKAAAEAAEAARGERTTSAVAVSPVEAQQREALRQQKAEIESLDRQTAFKESEERRLRAQVTEYQRRLEAVPGVETEYLTLSRDYETQQLSYKALLAKSEAAKVALDLERRQIGEQFRILDPAEVPQRPISPIRLQINAIGLGIGLVLGLGIAALLEFRDTTYRSESDVLDALSLPVLALVPHVATAEEQRQLGRKRWALSAAAAGVVVAGGYVFWTMQLWTRVI